MAERDDPLAARYRALATEEPSAVIDDAIRAAARRAVSAGPGVRRAAATRWAVPVSIAAVVFLSFGVVLQMQEQVPPLQDEMRVQPKAVEQEPVIAAKPEPQAEARAVQQPDAVKEKKRQALSMSQLPAPAPAKPVAPPAVVPGPVAAPPPAAASATVPAPSEAPASPMPRASSVPSASPPPPASTATAPRAFADSEVKPQGNIAPRLDPAPGRRDAAQAAAQAPASPSVPAPALRAKTEAFTAQRAAEGTAGALAKDRAEPWPDTPEKKLERIEALRKAGRDKDADEALARFKREHPDYRIPDATWERIRPK